MSCVLPEDLLVEILSERLQLNDCHRGVVFDGLETLFAQNLYTTAHAILRSLNNRRFIYVRWAQPVVGGYLVPVIEQQVIVNKVHKLQVLNHKHLFNEFVNKKNQNLR
jgi:hypothetical protein